MRGSNTRQTTATQRLDDSDAQFFRRIQLICSNNVVHAPSYYAEQHRLRTPEGFSRPINVAQLYTPFDMMKIQDMDEFVSHVPRMPLVLQPHDVYHEDWIRFIQVRIPLWSL